MDEVTKRRLVGGAVLLVALIAVTGLFFRGGGENSGAPANSGGQYSLEYPDDSGLAQAEDPLSFEEPAPHASTSLDSGTMPGESDTGPPPPSKVPDTDAAPLDEPASPKPAPAPVAKPKPAQPKPAPKSEPAKPAAKPAVVQATPPKSGQHDWAVQVGSFASRANAESLQKKLQGMGYPVSVSETQNKPALFRVRVGPYGTVEQAREAAGRLKTALKQDVKVVPAGG